MQTRFVVLAGLWVWQLGWAVLTVHAEARIGKNQKSVATVGLPVQNYAALDLGLANADGDFCEAVLNDQSNVAFSNVQPGANQEIVHVFNRGMPTRVVTYPSRLTSSTDEHEYSIVYGTLLPSGAQGTSHSHYIYGKSIEYYACLRTPDNLPGNDYPTPAPYRVDDTWSPNQEVPPPTPAIDIGNSGNYSFSLVLAPGQGGNFALSFAYYFDEPPSGPLPPNYEVQADGGLATKLVLNGITYYFDVDREAWNPLPADTAAVKYLDQTSGPLQITDSGWALFDVSRMFYGVFHNGDIVLNGLPAIAYGSYAYALNNQAWCLVENFSGPGNADPAGAIWHEGVAKRFVDLLKDTAWAGQIKNVGPQALSNANATDASIYMVATEQDSALTPAPGSTALPVEFALWKYASQAPVLPATTPTWRWQPYRMQLPPGMSLASLSAVNSSGVVLATGNAGTGDNHMMLLLPVQLTNKADPTIRNGANGNDMPIQFLQSSTDTNIGAVAWIAGNDPNNSNAPRMPHLQAQIGGPNGLPGTNVYWKLQVTFHDRHGNPHRDFDTGDPNDTSGSGTITPDTVVFPAYGSNAPNTENGWHKITDGTPWNIYNDPDWQTEVANGFFGGDAVLSVKVTTGDESAALAPQTDFKFRIAGENPDAGLCRAFIATQYGTQAVPTRVPSNPNLWKGFWFAAAIAKEETIGVGSHHYYNQFSDNGGQTTAPNPGHEGTPAWHDDGVPDPRTGTGGYGLYQLTYQPGDSNYPAMPRNWIWNWQANVTAVNLEWGPDLSKAQTLYAGLTGTYPGTILNHLQFSGLEAIMITYYNGMYGKKIKTVLVNGVLTKTCWYPNGHGTWLFLRNKQDYVDLVNTYAP